MKIKLASVLREFEIFETSSKSQKNILFDSFTYDPNLGHTKFSRFIANTQRAWKDNVILLDDKEIIGSGEDPRPFHWRGSPCASAATFNPAQGFINKIYVKNLGKWFALITPKNIEPGKNWAPFVRDGDLYFVHEYSPFRVLKAEFISERDDFMVLETVAEHDVQTSVSFDGFSRFRGGSNAVQIGDTILGIGHTNERAGPSPKSIIHRPFIFVYKPDVSLAYYSFNYDFPDTYGIVDSTSLYLKDGKLFLVTCETEYAWNVNPQRGRSCLYVMDISGAFDEDGFGLGGRRLYWWPYDKPSKIRRILGAWRRS